VAGEGVGSKGSPKRKLFEFFRLLWQERWVPRGLQVVFDTPETRTVARSLGCFYIWPLSTTVSTHPSVAPVVAPEFNAWHVTSRQLTEAFFVRLSPAVHICRLCGAHLRVDTARGYTNLVQHLRGRHYGNLGF
jgi:hypothetical protein